MSVVPQVAPVRTCPPVKGWTVEWVDGPEQTPAEVRGGVIAATVPLYPDRAAYELGLDPAGAQIDEMMMSLLPGERMTLTLTGLNGVDAVPVQRLAAVLSAPPVLRVLGDYTTDSPGGTP